MKKKKIILLILILLCCYWIVFYYLCFLYKKNGLLIEIYCNCGVWLQKPEKTDVIFRYEYKKGKDLEIFYYDDINTITKLSDFKKIGKNKQKVNNLIINYYNQLNLDQKSKFDNNVEIDELINSENYYFYENSTAIKNNDRYVLMIADKLNNKLYYINIRE
mgnify:FL=1